MMAPLPLLVLLLASAGHAYGPYDCSDEEWLYGSAMRGFTVLGTCGADEVVKQLNTVFRDGLPKARVDQVLANADIIPEPAAGPTAGERVPISAAVVRKAIKDMSKLLLKPADKKKEREVLVYCTTNMGLGSIGWLADLECKERLCGKLKIDMGYMGTLKDLHLQSKTSCAAKFAETQFGDGMLHELSHAIVSYLRVVYRPGGEDNAVAPQLTFFYAQHWDGTKPDSSCAAVKGITYLPGSGANDGKIRYTLEDNGYYLDELGNEKAARNIAQGVRRSCPTAVKDTLGLY